MNPKCSNKTTRLCAVCNANLCADAVDGDCDACLHNHAACIMSATGLTAKEYKKKYSKNKIRFCLRCEDQIKDTHTCKDTSVSYDDILIDINKGVKKDGV